MKHFPVSDIRSVALATPNIEFAEEFYTTVWGLEIVERHEGIVYLRASGCDHHVLALHSSASPHILSATFRTATLEELERVCATTTAHGGKVLNPPAANDGPDGGMIASITTPEGFLFHFVYGDRLHPEGGVKPDYPLRLSHLNLNCSDLDATRDFFKQVLGFDLTDRSKAMAFLRCNSDHHAIVLADSGVDGLNHVAFMMPGYESVMKGAGRMIDHGYPIGWGVGRHGPGNNIFAYFVDPAGFVIEYTSDVLQVDETYSVGGPDHWVWPSGRTDLWGIAPPKSDQVKYAQLAIKFAVPASDGQ